MYGNYRDLSPTQIRLSMSFSFERFVVHFNNEYSKNLVLHGSNQFFSRIKEGPTQYHPVFFVYIPLSDVGSLALGWSME